MELYYKNIYEIHNMLRRKELSCEELTCTILNRINNIDEKLGAYLTIVKESLSEAKAVDRKIGNGDYIEPLEGIPYSLKDNISTRKIKTTCGSKMLENYISPYDATVVERLKKNILVGKTNLDEFGMGSSTENSAYKITKNPWDLTKVPGGSSGGSAAAVASGLCFFSLGSDTGGSIRQPAAFCGVVGLKPTYGLVSRFGLVAYGSSLDTIGPITRNVYDCALVLNHISGYDTKDSTSVNRGKKDYTKGLKNGVCGLKIGIPKEYFHDGIDNRIKEKIIEVVKELEKKGAIIIDVNLPHTKYGFFTYYNIATAECSLNLSRFDGIRYGYCKNEYDNLNELYSHNRTLGFGKQVKKNIILGTNSLIKTNYEKYYEKGAKVRTLIIKDFKEVFKKVDLLITPTTPTLPFGIGEKIKDPIKMYKSDILTINANISGIPALSIPCGFIENMPVGVQIMGGYFNEEEVLTCAYEVERMRGEITWNTSL
ncbi:Asp-tRNA(Asn)/Glu-tRNA(Gln) amidotransferase subunit GatA [Anaeromicrobium sediminis]|uniref:Glutamyl-tRNA(Gln) amidotransferase subunit A n=1 Tax=Anaeromicrobium sediminis TaxID=1478221 RepID=A0A267MIC5_9FIRM|nr:Asp-tRNA(Asn)/Glu-tRNA(Gln) amidotransferase subunit GatA [Anaeromicrobium sediminis]PAB58550.1 Asp-tRNA(Asn)/Glu-tRNA(Gln) amidotransferase GatCAB subunit A [Anaeromicrobium sediminis]